MIAHYKFPIDADIVFEVLLLSINLILLVF